MVNIISDFSYISDGELVSATQLTDEFHADDVDDDELLVQAW